MSTTETGGPAFPQVDFVVGRSGKSLEFNHDGMTLRDYFAAKAMHAVILHPQGHAGAWNMAARHAYAMADAMLAARKQPTERTT